MAGRVDARPTRTPLASEDLKISFLVVYANRKVRSFRCLLICDAVVTNLSLSKLSFIMPGSTSNNRGMRPGLPPISNYVSISRSDFQVKLGHL
jgi:hypothetical protein